LDAPEPFTRIRNTSGKSSEKRVLRQYFGHRIEPPRSDYAPRRPTARNVTQIRIELIMPGITQWRGLIVSRAISGT
jgi:hypothetical protein